jgi:hypothetical protein
MSKTYSKSELSKKAVTFFKDYPQAKSVFATNDGHLFLSENRAALHKKSLKEGQYFEIENEGQSSSDDSKDNSTKKSADDLINEAKVIETVEAVEAAIVLETEGKSRKTVLAAYDARIEELKAE